MSLAGSFATMPAVDVLTWAAQRRLAAVITFEHGTLVRSVAIADGKIVSTTSAAGDEQIGNILVKSGRLAERALLDALELRAAIGVPLGRVLLMSGVVSEVDLVDVLTIKAREAVIDIAAWTGGSFELSTRAVLAAAAVPAPVDIAACVEAAHRHAPRMAAALALLGGDDTCFFIPHNAAAAPPADTFDLDVTRLWTLVGAGLPASRLAAVFGGRRARVFDLLATWVERGLLVIDRRRRARAGATAELVQAAQGRLTAGDPIGALDLASQAVDQDPGDVDVRRVFAAAERAHVARVAHRLFASPRPPRRAANVDVVALSLTTLELELLARVDGLWDVLSLIRGLSVRDADAIRALGRLADVGAIELGGPLGDPSGATH